MKELKFLISYSFENDQLNRNHNLAYLSDLSVYITSLYLWDTCTVGSPERARWDYVARLGSQSQRRIWLI